MDIRRLLVLVEEYNLTTRDISLILEIPEYVIKDALKGRIKPKKPKRSWVRSQRKFIRQNF
jgi:hypothetical protein